MHKIHFKQVLEFSKISEKFLSKISSQQLFGTIFCFFFSKFLFSYFQKFPHRGTHSWTWESHNSAMAEALALTWQASEQFL